MLSWSGGKDSSLAFAALRADTRFEVAGLDTVREAAPDISHIAFGDLFLTEIREYRACLVAGTGFKPLFPLWEQDTGQLARRFVDEGYEAHLVCVDTTQLGAVFAGRRFDHELLADLSDEIDPCGERGEFHTFVSGGPCFDGRVDHLPFTRIGGIIARPQMVSVNE